MSRITLCVTSNGESPDIILVSLVMLLDGPIQLSRLAAVRYSDSYDNGD